jgi:hypothetical protein
MFLHKAWLLPFLQRELKCILQQSLPIRKARHFVSIRKRLRRQYFFLLYVSDCENEAVDYVEMIVKRISIW